MDISKVDPALPEWAKPMTKARVNRMNPSSRPARVEVPQDARYLLYVWWHWAKEEPARLRRSVKVAELLELVPGRLVEPRVSSLLRQLKRAGLVTEHTMLGWQMTPAGQRLAPRV